MFIVTQYRHNHYIKWKVMMIYSYDNSYIVIGNCHKHDTIICYGDFNDRG
jgi:hypothetical protein